MDHLFAKPMITQNGDQSQILLEYNIVKPIRSISAPTEERRTKLTHQLSGSVRF